MKNRDLSKAIGNIDLKYVEEAEIYTAKRMTLTKVISLAACIAILVAAIPATLILNREDVETDAPVVTTPFEGEDNTPNNGQDDPINTEALKVIYCDANMLGEVESVKDEIFKDPEVVLGRYNAFYSEMQQHSRKEYNEEMPLSFTLAIGNQKYNCYFDYAYNSQALFSANETLKSFAGIACYKIEQVGNVGEVGYRGEVRYRIATKEIVYVSIKRIYQFPSDLKTEEEYEQWRTENLGGNLTHEDLKVLADKDMKLLYGDDALSTYTYDDYNSGNGMFWYRRTVDGFPTSECIYMKYTSKGELLELEAENLGVFDVVEDKLTSDKVLKAHAEALEIINEDYIKFKEVVMGRDAELYIYYHLEYADKINFVCYKVE